MISAGFGPLISLCKHICLLNGGSFDFVMVSECSADGQSGGLRKNRLVFIVLDSPSSEWIHNVKASNHYSVHLCP